LSNPMLSLLTLSIFATDAELTAPTADPAVDPAAVEQPAATSPDDTTAVVTPPPAADDVVAPPAAVEPDTGNAAPPAALDPAPAAPAADPVADFISCFKSHYESLTADQRHAVNSGVIGEFAQFNTDEEIIDAMRQLGAAVPQRAEETTTDGMLKYVLRVIRGYSENGSGDKADFDKFVAEWVDPVNAYSPANDHKEYGSQQSAQLDRIAQEIVRISNEQRDRYQAWLAGRDSIYGLAKNYRANAIPDNVVPVIHFNEATA